MLLLDQCYLRTEAEEGLAETGRMMNTAAENSKLLGNNQKLEQIPSPQNAGIRAVL